MAMENSAGDQAAPEKRDPKLPPPLPGTPGGTTQPEQSTQSPFPWGRLALALVAVFAFAVSRLIKHRNADGGWDPDRVVFTLMMCAIASAVVVGVVVFFHMREKNQS
jgi:hypothetical protein